MTGNDVTCPHVTRGDPEVMTFGRKSPGAGSSRPIGQVLGKFELLQGHNCRRWESRDRK